MIGFDKCFDCIANLTKAYYYEKLLIKFLINI